MDIVIVCYSLVLVLCIFIIHRQHIEIQELIEKKYQRKCKHPEYDIFEDNVERCMECWERKE